MAGGRVTDHLCGVGWKGGEGRDRISYYYYFSTRGISYSGSVLMARRPRGNCIFYPLPCPDVATPGNISVDSTLSYAPALSGQRQHDSYPG